MITVFVNDCGFILYFQFKSRSYYEEKAKQNKELKFLHSKIEGLKLCLKEAKMTYQKSLSNLESISNEIHGLRGNIIAEPKSEITTTKPEQGIYLNLNLFCFVVLYIFYACIF